MAREIRTKLDGWTTFTQTLASLTNGSARQSTIVTNSNNRPAALFFYRIQSGGTAPTAGAVYEIYLIRGTGQGTNERTDGAGSTDAPITVVNAQLVGTLVVTANPNTNFQDEFDTAPLGPLGTEFGSIVRNASGQSLNATEGNHIKKYNLYLPEIQNET
jgi:hypothetical protein